MNFYKTKDLYLSTHLVLCGLKLKEVKPINRNQIEFIFEDPENKSEELIRSFWEHTIKFPPQRVLNEFKQLKARIFISVNK